MTTTLSNQTTAAGAAFNYSLPTGLFSEAIAGDTLTYSASLVGGQSLPSWLTFNSITGQFSGVAGDQNVGALAITITATDLSGLTASTTLNVTVTAAYAPPVVEQAFYEYGYIQTTPSLLVAGAKLAQINVNQLGLTMQGTFIANNNPQAGFVALVDTSVAGQISFWAETIDGASTKAVQIVLTDSAEGVLIQAVQAKYTQGIYATGSFNFNTSGIGESICTTWNGSGYGISAIAGYLLPPSPSSTTGQTLTQSITAGSAFSYTLPGGLFYESVPGDTLTYSATLVNGQALPNWLSFNAMTGQFSGTPTDQTTGNLELTVTATDQGGSSVSTLVMFTITPVYQTPTVTQTLAAQTVVAGAAFSYGLPSGLFSESVAGDTLTYSAALSNGQALPSWLTINTATGQLSGQAPRAPGDLSVVMTATDMGGNSVSTKLSLQGVIDVSRSSGAQTVLETSGALTTNDEVSFSPDISSNQLWFSHSGNNLVVNVIGTTNSLTIENWYATTADQVTEFIAGDGKVLNNANVQSLVNAMAAMAPPVQGQTALSSTQSQQLVTVLAANWH
jgi:hypothetical protein